MRYPLTVQRCRGCRADKSSLDQSVESFAEAQDAVRVRGVDETLRLPHVKSGRVREVSVEISVDEIGLFDRHAPCRSDSERGADCGESRDWCV